VGNVEGAVAAGLASATGDESPKEGPEDGAPTTEGTADMLGCRDGAESDAVGDAGDSPSSSVDGCDEMDGELSVSALGDMAGEESSLLEEGF